MNLRTSASLVRRVKSLYGTQGPANRYLGLVIYDWGGKLRKSEQVGGRAHAPKRYSTHSFVWDGGGNGHPNCRGDAFLVLN